MRNLRFLRELFVVDSGDVIRDPFHCFPLSGFDGVDLIQHKENVGIPTLQLPQEIKVALRAGLFGIEQENARTGTADLLLGDLSVMIRRTVQTRAVHQRYTIGQEIGIEEEVYMVDTSRDAVISLIASGADDTFDRSRVKAFQDFCAALRLAIIHDACFPIGRTGDVPQEVDRRRRFGRESRQSLFMHHRIQKGRLARTELAHDHDAEHIFLHIVVENTQIIRLILSPQCFHHLNALVQKIHHIVFPLNVLCLVFVRHASCSSIHCFISPS